MNFKYIEHYNASFADDCVANSNLTTVYAIIPLDILVHEFLVTLNTALQTLVMVLMLKITNSNISYSYSKNTTTYLSIITNITHTHLK